eukprot:13946579-Heterocapsa_arctica.AAC.1
MLANAQRELCRAGPLKHRMLQLVFLILVSFSMSGSLHGTCAMVTKWLISSDSPTLQICQQKQPLP